MRRGAGGASARAIGRTVAGVIAIVGATACAEPAVPPSSGGTTGSAESSDGEAASDPHVGTSSAPDDGDDTSSAGTSTGAGNDDDSTGEPAPPEGFEPFDCDRASPDVTIDRLCDEAADPRGAADEIFITCRIEGSCAGPVAPEPQRSVVVMAYNVARGHHVDDHIALMLDDDPVVPRPDVLLLSEIDRGCARTGERNLPWEYAEGLGMNHVYAVEFVELPRPDGSITAPCEHGNAILSRYPIGNVQAVRHATNKSWYDVADEPRLGGRIAVVADILVGDRLLQVHSLHFESGVFDNPIRAAQAAELAELALRRGTPAVIGGDTNAGTYVVDLFTGTMNDPTTQAFFTRGFVDTHAELPVTDRPTKDQLVLDIMFTSEPLASAPAVCPSQICEPFSDHLPIWTTITVP